MMTRQLKTKRQSKWMKRDHRKRRITRTRATSKKKEFQGRTNTNQRRFK